MSEWILENVEDAARARPRSFFLPLREERRGQALGDEVRLHFLLTGDDPDLPRAERMWVLIVETRGDRYVGELTNEPTAIKGLTVGDRVEFGPEHIAQTIIKRSDPRWFEAAEKDALVSAAVFEEGKSTTWMYREPVTRDEDSGWRLFTGDETEAELADASRVRICKTWLG